MSKDSDGDLGGMCKQTQFLTVITTLKHSCGKVMFLHLSVILFRGGGVMMSLPVMAPPMAYPRTAPPSPHGQQAVRILLECFLSSA